MRATFKADIPASALNPRDPRASFQTVMAAKVVPITQRIVATARSSTRHKGVAAAYQATTAAVGNKVTSVVTNDHPLFPIIEGGSRPHIIRPIRGKFLRFTVGSEVIFAREAHHPGTRPQRVLANAFKSHESETERAIQEGVAEWLRASLGSDR